MKRFFALLAAPRIALRASVGFGLLALVCAGGALDPAGAAVTPNSVVLPQGWSANDVAQIANATGTGTVTFATGAANGSKVLSAVCSSTDTVAHTLLVYHVIAATSYLVAAISIPASAGDAAATPPVQLITNAAIPGPITGSGNRYLPLGNGDTLGFAVTAAVTSGDTISCTGEQVNF